MRVGNFVGQNNKGTIIYNGVIIGGTDLYEVLRGYGGFIHSGSAEELRVILATTPSNQVIPVNINNRNNNTIIGNGVYFRAVSKKNLSHAKKVISNVNAAGFSEPIYYFMPTVSTVGLEIIYAAPVSEEGRNRSYGSINGPNFLWDSNLYRKILRNAVPDRNRTEILFFNAVPFNRVTDIFIDEDMRSTKGLVNTILRQNNFIKKGKLEKYLGYQLHHMVWFTLRDGSSPIYSE